ncbi:glycosyltransferase family 4 protein [Vagococcus fluvialis]|uniref:glycosyltransferase family 4 protein n=1 Tax=Vagococcus fluvialis TaxID=2738 RepID=UPI0032E3AE38
MKVIVLTQQYPSEDDLYRNAFVHTRIKQYQNIDPTIIFKVFILSDNNENRVYTYDGVEVIVGTESYFLEIIEKDRIDCINVHFLLKRMMDLLLNNQIKEIKKVIWIHGYEALSWKRRVFDLFNKSFITYPYHNYKQLKSFNSYVINEKNSEYIFVSEWMKMIAESDIKEKFLNSYIIPNGIDIDFYDYKKKNGLEKNILLIRPFNSRKYATDIAMKTIKLLSKEDDFFDYKITIVGSGKYFEKDTCFLKQYKNVRLIESFLNKDEIKKLHSNHGIFLCPTRQDAQGVSMCEAMSSGLIPITSNNTAIPEFVSSKEGYLCDSPTEFKNAIVSLKNKELFHQKSKNARKRIENQCNLREISQKELMLMREDKKI